MRLTISIGAGADCIKELQDYKPESIGNTLPGMDMALGKSLLEMESSPLL